MFVITAEASQTAQEPQDCATPESPRAMQREFDQLLDREFGDFPCPCRKLAIYECKWGLYFGRKREDNLDEESNEETVDQDTDGETPPHTPTRSTKRKPQPPTLDDDLPTPPGQRPT